MKHKRHKQHSVKNYLYVQNDLLRYTILGACEVQPQILQAVRYTAQERLCSQFAAAAAKESEREIDACASEREKIRLTSVDMTYCPKLRIRQ